MLKTNEKRMVNVVKIGDVRISVTSVASKYVTLELTGREYGFKTGIKLYFDQCKQLMNLLDDCKHRSNHPVQHTLTDVYAKNIVCTKEIHESDFTHKFSEDRHACIKTMAIGGHCIISICAEDRNYRTVSFEIYRYIDEIEKLRNYVNSVSMNNRMNNWN